MLCYEITIYIILFLILFVFFSSSQRLENDSHLHSDVDKLLMSENLNLRKGLSEIQRELLELMQRPESGNAGAAEEEGSAVWLSNSLRKDGLHSVDEDLLPDGMSM